MPRYSTERKASVLKKLLTERMEKFVAEREFDVVFTTDPGYL